MLSLAFFRESSKRLLFTAVRSSFTRSTATRATTRVNLFSASVRAQKVLASMLQDASISFVRRAFAQC